MTAIARILYVDDDANDRTLMHAAGEELREEVSITCLPSGGEAIRYLIGEGKYADRNAFPFPTLIITDLKMPDGDGLELLEFIRGNPGWSVVPRIVYSGSRDADDVKKAFMLGASAYHTKSFGEGTAAKRLLAILTYWRLSELPPVDRQGRLLVTDSAGKVGERYPQPQGGSAMHRVT